MGKIVIKKICIELDFWFGGEFFREGGNEGVLCNYKCGGRRKGENRYSREESKRTVV